MTTASWPGEAVTERVLWIGADTRPLCLRLHLPGSGEVRGGVLLCPPLGREANVTHATYRQLAEELALAGLVAARLDYVGTGDSAGSQREPGNVAAWVESVTQGVQALRAFAEVPVTVLGMTMGGLLAASALAGAPDPVDLLVLWDPSASGRGWLREQRALLLIGAGSSGFGAVATPGDAAELEAASRGRENLFDIPSFAYRTEDAADIQQLSFQRVRGKLANRVVVFERPDRPLGTQVKERLASENVEWRSAHGQVDLLVIASDYAVVPVTTLREVVASVSDGALAVPRPLVLPEAAPKRFTHPDADGVPQAIIEEHVRLGPVGLVGVTSRPDNPLPGAPLLILLGNSNEPHTGPSRAWVELSRQWAAEGLSTLRVCLSGLGDSPVRPGQIPQIIYAEEALEDIKDVIEATNDPAGHGGASNVVLVGLCSGGYEAIEGALAFGARGVCVMGLLPGAGLPFELLGGNTPRPVHSGAETRRQAAIPVNGWLRRGSQSRRAWEVAARVPQFVWAIADRLGLLPSPARPLKRLSAAGIDTLFIVGTRDARAYRVFAAGLIRRLQRRGFLHMHYVPALDHGMLRAGPRERALALVDSHVRSTYLAPKANVDAPAPH